MTCNDVRERADGLVLKRKAAKSLSSSLSNHKGVADHPTSQPGPLARRNGVRSRQPGSNVDDCAAGVTLDLQGSPNRHRSRTEREGDRAHVDVETDSAFLSDMNPAV